MVSEGRAVIPELGAKPDGWSKRESPSRLPSHLPEHIPPLRECRRKRFPGYPFECKGFSFSPTQPVDAAFPNGMRQRFLNETEFPIAWPSWRLGHAYDPRCSRSERLSCPPSWLINSRKSLNFTALGCLRTATPKRRASTLQAAITSPCMAVKIAPYPFLPLQCLQPVIFRSPRKHAMEERRMRMRRKRPFR